MIGATSFENAGGSAAAGARCPGGPWSQAASAADRSSAAAHVTGRATAEYVRNETLTSTERRVKVPQTGRIDQNHSMRMAIVNDARRNGVKTSPPSLKRKCLVVAGKPAVSVGFGTSPCCDPSGGS